MYALLSFLVMLAAPILLAAPRDDAMEYLAADQPGPAIAALEAGVGAEPELVCLVAEVQHLHGASEEALARLDRGPLHGCAAQADWLRAEILLSLGRGEAAGRLYAQLGQHAVGPDRGRMTALRLLALAGRLQERREPDGEQIAQVLALALELTISESLELQIARALADSAAAHGGSAHSAIPVFERAVEVGTAEDADRLRLARLSQDARFLAGLPASPEVLALRLSLLDGYHLSALEEQILLARALVAGWPDSSQAREARSRVGARLAEVGWIVEAEELLLPLAEGADAVAEEALWHLAGLAVRAGQPEEALARLQDFRARFPASARHAEAVEAHLALQQEAARQALAADLPQEALAHYEALIRDLGRDPRAAEAGLEAALAERALGDLPAARQRLEEILSRWPGTEAAARALRVRFLLQAADERDPHGAMAWLEGRRAADPSQVQALHDEVTEEILELRSPAGAAGPGASVTVFSANVREVEVRLHRIDPEAFLRGGGAPERLDALDVEIIEPYRAWTVEVPQALPYQIQRWELPVPVPAPGLYAVTVGTPQRSARVILQASQARILARRAHGEVLVAPLFGNRPHSGARVLVASGAGVTEVRADASGLARLPDPGGALVLLADAGGPALLSLPDEPSPPQPTTYRVGIDLDRPVYRPGDTLRFRLASPEHREGSWRLWLEAGDGRPAVEHAFPVDAEGLAHGTLSVPLAPAGSRDGKPWYRELSLRGIPPGGSDPEHMAHVMVVDDVLTSVRWETTTPTTGRPPPQDGPAPEPYQPLLSARQPVLAPGEVLRLDVEDADLVVVRQEVRAPDGRGVPWPWPVLEDAGLLQHPLSEDGPGQPALWRTVAQAPVAEGTAQIAGLEAGRYEVLAVRSGDGGASEPLSVAVVAGSRLLAPTEAGVGEVVEIRSEGEPALVTLRAGDVLTAAILKGGQAMRVPVDPRWPHQVPVEAITAGGRLLERTIAIDQHLRVSLEVEEEGLSWRIRARVEDAAGRPVDAQVALRGFDQMLKWNLWHPPMMSAGSLLSSGPGGTTWGAVLGLSDTDRSRLRARLLLQERDLQEDLRRARVALTGDLSENALQGLLVTNVPLSTGTSGYGAMGGSFGARGGGSVGSLGGEGVGGRSRSLPLRLGEREAILWEVARTGPDGVLEVRIPRSGRPTRWDIDAIAVAGSVVGTARAKLRTDTRPALLVTDLPPGAAGERAEPHAIVFAGQEPLQAAVQIGEASVPVSLDAWQSVAVPLGPQQPGASLPVRLRAASGGALLAEEVFDWPLLGWTVPLRVVVGPGGAPARAALALEADPMVLRDPGRAANAALSIAAVLPHLEGSERQAALDRLAALVGGLSPQAGDYRSVTDVAQAIAALAEARRWLTVRGLALEQLDGTVPIEQASREERTRLLWARALAGRPVSDASLSRLLREQGEMDAEERALLARALVLLGRPADLRIEGDGPQARLARAELAAQRRLRRPDAPQPVVIPPPGDPDRPAALALLPEPPRRPMRGERALRLEGGAPLGTLDLARGGTLLSEQAGRVEGLEGISAAITAWTPGGRPEVAGAGLRLPRGAAVVTSAADWEASACQPCRIAVGDAVRVQGDLSGAWIPAGLMLAPDPSPPGVLLTGVAPGRHTVRGILGTDGAEQALVIEVVAGRAEDLSPLAPAVAVAMAEGSEAPEAWLVGRERLEDWPPELRSRVARVRFDRAVQTGAGLVEAFEDLRDLDPQARIPLAALAATAAAYAPERPERAIELWQVCLGAAFQEEAAIAARLDPVIGPLASIQVLWEVASRYPRVPAVEQALFSLPDRLAAMAEGGLPPEVQAAGVHPIDVELMAAAWSREFVLRNPRSALSAQAGLRLAVGLLRMGAVEPAATWAARTRQQHPGHALTDRLLLVEGLARGELGQRRQALQRLDQIEGLPIRSAMAEDAVLAAARIREGGGDLRGAAEQYREVQGTFAEADASLEVLERRALEIAPLLTFRAGQGVTLPLQSAGIEEVGVRAYALDLQTLFLRDEGLGDAAQIEVSGASPVLEARRRLPSGPFARPHALRLSLPGPGAYLVQVEGGGVHDATLVLITDLEVDVVDSGAVRRLTVLRRGRPAPGVALRAIQGDLILGETDSRGVALIPAGAPALLLDGPHLAFAPARSPHGSAEVPVDALVARLQAELVRLREEARLQLDAREAPTQEGVVVSSL